MWRSLTPLSVPTRKSSTLVTVTDGLFGAPRAGTARAGCGNEGKVKSCVGMCVVASSSDHSPARRRHSLRSRVLMKSPLSIMRSSGALTSGISEIFLPGAALCQRRLVPLPQSLDQRLGRNDHHVDLNAARFPASSALMRQVDAGLFCGCNRGTAFWGWVSAYGLGEGSVGWSDRRRPWHGRISGALTPGPISLR